MTHTLALGIQPRYLVDRAYNEWVLLILKPCQLTQHLGSWYSK